MWLQQQRKLKLDDEVRKYIPELPGYGKPLCIRHLLWHTSGLRCYSTMLWWGGVAQRDNYSRKQALELVYRQKELNFQPGTDCLYGNTNYLLLSEIVERVSGKSIAEFCHRLIFEPLGMTSTHFRDKPGLPIKNLVSGHFQWWGQGGLLVDRNLGAIAGVGRLMSSVDDLARWEQFFVKPKKSFLPVLRSMLTPGWLENGQKIRFGGGMMLQRYRGLAMQRHDGFTSGCRSEFCRFPEKGVAMVCMTNHTKISPTWLIRQIADSLWSRELEPVSALGPGQPPAPQPRAKLKPAQLKEREGLYRVLDEGAFAELRLRDGVLYFYSMYSAIELAPDSVTGFQGQGAGRIYRLDFEEHGGFILTKQGRATRYERLNPSKKAADAKFERFAGRYASPELVSRMDVKAKDGKLWLNDSVGFEWELQHLKGGHFYNYFREISFSKRGMVMLASDQWVRKLKWVKL